MHFVNVVGIRHLSNGFDDLLSNQVITPELTIADNGSLLNIALFTEASTYSRLDGYISNSLGHHLPDRIFSSELPLTDRRLTKVGSSLLCIQNAYCVVYPYTELTGDRWQLFIVFAKLLLL